MDKADRTAGTQKKGKKSGNSRARWIILVFLSTIVISASFSTLSAAMLDGSGIFAAMAILLAIVFIGILFDIVGVAVTAAEERPLHSMAVGDICGVISGSASAVIAVQLLENFTLSPASIVNVAMSAMVAGLTVGGKAVGKGIAMRYSVSIIHFVGKLMAIVRKPFSSRKRNKRKSKR